MAELTRDNCDSFGICKPLNDFRKELQKRATPSEKRFLEYAKLQGEFVRPQAIYGYFIADFLFPFRNVVVELDGSSHEGREEYDQRRDSWILKCGTPVLRFPNEAPDEEILSKVREYPVVSGKQTSKSLLKARSLRTVEQELRLLSKGLKHANGRKLVTIDVFTKKQLPFTKRLDLVVDLPIRSERRSVTGGKCPNCRGKVNWTFIRCAQCSAILRFGWIDHVPVKRPKPKPISTTTSAVSVKRGRVAGKRPRCTNCGRGLAQGWTTCKGCQVVICWTD